MLYLTEDNRFLLKQKPASNLPYHRNFHLFGVENDVASNARLHNLFFVLSQKVLIAETRINAISGDTNKVLSIKKLYNK